jgi:AraC-like DNA-binding protein
MNRYQEVEDVLAQYHSVLSEADSNYPEIMNRALDCMHQNLFKEKLTVSWMEKKCHISSKSFAAKFDLYVGLTPKAYILHHRIEAAQLLLKSTGATITIIAVSLGFASLSSFDKAFKAHAGQTPSDWRNSTNGQVSKTVQ